jgi:hypothetical protein
MKARLISAAVILCMTGSVWAQGRELVTALTQEEASVGDSVVLIYRFVNTPNPSNMPQSISVDGLDVTFMTARTEDQLNFSFGRGGLRGQPTKAMEFMYKVTALEPGVHTIPSLTIDVGGKSMKTKSVKLRVLDRGTPVPRALPAQPMGPPSTSDPFDQLNQMMNQMNQMMQGGTIQIPIPMPGGPGFPLPMPQPGRVPRSSGRDGGDFFAEMNLGAKTAYVGQAVPVDLRFYFPAEMVRDGWEPPPPQFSGDGFSVASLSPPKQTDGERDGAQYRIVTFRTTIIPAKTGDLEIPPATVGLQLIGGFGRPEEIKVTSNAAKLRVDPLPEEGRPLSFSGAIGQDLKLSSSVSPKSAEPGEPLEYTLTISGRGNFDAMVAPELNAISGWRTYQPKETFQADDATGFGGSKSFEYKIVARRDQTVTPGAEFSYFDLAEKKYVTRVAEPIAVDAKGRESSAAESASDGSSPPAAGATERAEALAQGIGEAAKDFASRGKESFAPLLSSPSFWWINLSIAAAFLIALPLVLWARRRAARNALSHELHWALKQAQSALAKASDRAEFYNAAAHLVQARLAVGEGKKARFIDTGAALRRQVEDPMFRREIESVLGRRDELKYGGSSTGSLDPVEKNRVVAVLDKFSANHE